jgi:hypothetical protein
MSELNYYEYRVTFVGDYWDFNIRVQISLEEEQGNLSDEAKNKALEEAEAQEWAANISAMSHEVEVYLISDGQDVRLNGEE